MVQFKGVGLEFYALQIEISNSYTFHCILYLLRDVDGGTIKL